MPPADEQVRAAFEAVEEPVLHRSLGSLGLAGPVQVSANRMSRSRVMVLAWVEVRSFPEHVRQER